VNPEPPIVAAFTITGAVPVELNVTVCAAVEFTATLPNDNAAELTFSVGTEAPS
jgi:molybdopterin-binding protein